jgi:hypothetical protein
MHERSTPGRLTGNLGTSLTARIIDGWAQHNRWPVSGLLMSRLRTETDPDDVASVWHIGSHHRDPQDVRHEQVHDLFRRLPRG